MAHHLNNLLYERFLVTEIWLEFQDVFVAAICCVCSAFILAFASQMLLIQSMFSKDSFNALWLIWVLRMIGVLVSYAHSSGVRGPSEGSGVLFSRLVAMSVVGQYSTLCSCLDLTPRLSRVPESPYSCGDGCLI